MCSLTDRARYQSYAWLQVNKKWMSLRIWPMPLQFTEIITLELSKRDANLAFADREFEWALETLKSFQNPFATRLYQSLLNRILQRREQDIATLLAYLKKSRFLDMLGNDPKPKHLSYSSREEMAKAAVALYVRLFSNEDFNS